MFFPRLSLSLQPAPYRDRIAFPPPLRFLISITPILICLIFLFSLLSIGAELRQIKRSLNGRSTSLDSEWNNQDVSDTVTVTSTILTDGHSQWWFGGSPNILATPETTSTPSRFSYPSATPTPTSSSLHGETDALLPISSFSFSWPLQFDFPLDTILRGLGTVWQVLRRVYHYPLDPP
jgi:hypothetical protein